MPMPSVLTTFLGSLLLLSLSAQAASTEEINRWIDELASPVLRNRLAAEKQLWAAGQTAQQALESASQHRQPEIALRAKKIARYLSLGLTPDSPAEIITLAKEFSRLNPDAKIDAITKLKKQRRFRLALQLTQQEDDPAVRPRLRNATQGLSIIAARDALMQNDENLARRYLTDFPEDPRNTMALAWLARCHGRLDQEIAQARKSNDPQSYQSLIALLRLKGNLADVAALAEKHNLPDLAAAMELLQGNPEAWLSWHADRARGETADITRAYIKAALHRLRTHEHGPASSLSFLTKTAQKQGDYSRRWVAIQALASLSWEQAAHKAIQSLNPTILFQTHLELERVDAALAAFDLEPENPDFSTWLEKRFHAIAHDEDEHEMESVPQLIGFLEKRGVTQPIEQTFIPQMLKMAENDPETFTDLLSILFAHFSNTRLAPETAAKIAAAYAKDDDVLWGSMLRVAFSDNPFFTQWWQWLGEMSPTDSRADRFRKMLVLFRIIPDHQRELAALEKSIRKSLDQDPADAAEAHRKLCSVLAAITRVTLYARWACLDESELDADDLMNLGLWELAAVSWESALKVNPDAPHTLLWSALCWRLAKQEDRASAAEKKYHSLVLGDSAMMLAAASIYQHLGFPKEAQEWRWLALRTAPRNAAWHVALYQHADECLLHGQWRLALAGYEAFALFSVDESSDSSLSHALRVRQKADIARGFSLLSSEPVLAKKILRGAHQTLMTDAALADQFFPALRLAGAKQEHDAWFEESWQQFLLLRDRFPKDDNIRNSAAWLASRAVKRLDDAEKEATEALRLRPNQAAYLDTLAEIHFARGNRSQAISWSEKALKADPSATSLREQYYRFQRDPFPR